MDITTIYTCKEYEDMAQVHEDSSIRDDVVNSVMSGSALLQTCIDDLQKTAVASLSLQNDGKNNSMQTSAVKIKNAWSYVFQSVLQLENLINQKNKLIRDLTNEIGAFKQECKNSSTYCQRIMDDRDALSSKYLQEFKNYQSRFKQLDEETLQLKLKVQELDAERNYLQDRIKSRQAPQFSQLPENCENISSPLKSPLGYSDNMRLFDNTQSSPNLTQRTGCFAIAEDDSFPVNVSLSRLDLVNNELENNSDKQQTSTSIEEEAKSKQFSSGGFEGSQNGISRRKTRSQTSSEQHNNDSDDNERQLPEMTAEQFVSLLRHYLGKIDPQSLPSGLEETLKKFFYRHDKITAERRKPTFEKKNSTERAEPSGRKLRSSSEDTSRKSNAGSRRKNTQSVPDVHF